MAADSRPVISSVPTRTAASQVCQSFAHWSSDKGRTVRILVRYAIRVALW